MLPAIQMVDAPLLKTHQEAELGKVDVQKARALQQVKAPGRPGGEEEPAQFLLHPFPGGKGLEVSLEEAGMVGKGVSGFPGQAKAQAGSQAHRAEASEMVLVKIGLPYGNQHPPVQILVRPADAEDAVLPPEKSVKAEVPLE
ncbi:hypothetical protein WCE16_22850, partial [Atlantibacter hermannii]